MQGLRFKFGDRRQDRKWKCCLCCHVRTGTIFLGISHLVLQVLALSVMAVFLRHPDLIESDMAPVLPTPLSEVDNNVVVNDVNARWKLTDDENTLLPHSYRDIFGRRPFNHEDMNVGVVVTFCTFAITLMLVYGAVKGKPSYLMPFFCLQLFDFCLASLSAVGYLSYLPDIRATIDRSNHIPFKYELLHMSPYTLSAIALLMFLVAMIIKGYFISVVWSCYKYLTLRQVAAQRTIQLIDRDVQNLIPDLPDYETAVKKFPAPPPSYAIAMQSHHPVVEDSHNQQTQQQQPQQTAATVAASHVIVPAPTVCNQNSAQPQPV